MKRAPRATDAGAAERRKENDRFRKKEDPINALYRNGNWPKCAGLHKNRNPICQRIRNGRQCTNPAWLVHHLISPRQRPDLFLDFKNLVSLCEHCHPTSEGTPEWLPGFDYVASVIELPMCF